MGLTGEAVLGQARGNARAVEKHARRARQILGGSGGNPSPSDADRPVFESNSQAQNPLSPVAERKIEL